MNLESGYPVGDMAVHIHNRFVRSCRDPELKKPVDMKNMANIELCCSARIVVDAASPTIRPPTGAPTIVLHEWENRPLKSSPTAHSRWTKKKLQRVRFGTVLGSYQGPSLKTNADFSKVSPFVPATHVSHCGGKG